MNQKHFTTIMDMLGQFESSEKTALICGDETLTYRQLIQDAKHIARGLMQEGVRKGDRVLLNMRSCADAFRGMFGVLYAGGVYIAADPEWPEERINYAAKDGKAVFSLTESVCRDLLSRNTGTAELPKVEPEEEAAIYYTSGSTGEPKGVVLHHVVFGTVLGSDFSNRIEVHPEFSKWESSICTYRLPFVATIIDICIIFSEEKTMLMPTDAQLYSLDLFMNLIRTYHPEVIASTPSIIERFLGHPEFARLFAEFGYVFFGGEPLTKERAVKISKATEAKLLVIYGSTEMFLTAAFCYQNDGRVHLGRPGYDVKLYLLDDHQKAVSVGEKGELYIGGTPAQFGHYLNQPDVESQVYLEHPLFGRLYRTGDRGLLEADGQITLIGRADQMVKLHGQRIEIGEVESAIRSFPGVIRAAAAIQKYEGKDALCGFYTAEKELDDRTLREHLSKRLPIYMIPAFLRRLSSMPENGHGKLEYRKLPQVEKEVPLVSVLTPVHNVPLEIFERTIRSVLALEYEKERIEWLIAVHNMDDDYGNKIREMTDTCSGVHVLDCKEPKCLLGAVRNFLLEQASGRYLFWLDADDELKPDAIQTAVSAMEKKNADMLLYPCEERSDDGAEELFPRILNMTGKEEAVFEPCEPGFGALMTGCAGDVWSWCWRRAFLKNKEIRFDEAEVGHFCDPLFVAQAVVRSKRVMVLPEKKGPVYHIRKGSDSQVRVKEEMYETSLELIRLMERVRELEETFCVDLNLFQWFFVRNACHLFGRADVQPEQKLKLHKALQPLVRNLRILSPCPVFCGEAACYLSEQVALLFPEEANAFQHPRIEQIEAPVSELPSEEEIRERIHAASFTGFHMLGDERHVYLGIEEESAMPSVVSVSLPQKNRELFVQGYRKTEKLRGFKPLEVPLRITLFHEEGSGGKLLFTWDTRFIHESAIRWLSSICGKGPLF